MSQTIEEKIAIAAQIVATNPWRAWEHQRCESEWITATLFNSTLFYALEDEHCVMRLKAITLLTPDDGRALHNPDDLTAEQVGEGWRLLLPEEVDGRHVGHVQLWAISSENWTTGNGIFDQDKSSTYRIYASTPWPPHRWTKEMERIKQGGVVEWRASPDQKWTTTCISTEISKEAWNDPQIEFRIRPEPRRVPLTVDDVPPCSVFRMKGQQGWLNLDSVGFAGVAFSTKMLYYDNLVENYEILRPGGKWEPCFKEVSE